MKKVLNNGVFIRPKVEYLKCSLDNQELLEKSSRLAAAQAKLKDLEDEMDCIKSDLKTRMKKEEAEMELLFKAIREKAEYRNVKCEWRFNFPERGEKTLYRLDGIREESVRCEVMSDSDCQSTFEDVPLGKDACDTRTESGEVKSE